MLQVADVGINRFPNNVYEKEYAVSMCEKSVTGVPSECVERIEYVARTVQTLKEKQEVSCGLLYGYEDVTQNYTPAISKEQSEFDGYEITETGFSFYYAVRPNGDVVATIDVVSPGI